MTSARRPARLFITGTDTNVGKTHVTCLIARQLIAQGTRVAAYKPVCSGAIPAEQVSSDQDHEPTNRWDDIERLKGAIGSDWSDDWICPQRFLAPLAPSVAARLEGRFVDFQQLIDGANRFDNSDNLELLLIEGVGGWLSPVTETRVVADLARELNAAVLIVARSGLGTINHTLMTIASVRASGLTVAGVILNEVLPGASDQSIQTNGAEIEARSGVPVLGTVPHGNSLELLQSGLLVTINWKALAESPLATSSSVVAVEEPKLATAAIVLSASSNHPLTTDQSNSTEFPIEKTNVESDVGWPASANFHFVDRWPEAANPIMTERESAASGLVSNSPIESWIDVANESERAESFATMQSSVDRSNSHLLTLLILVGSYASLLTIYLVYRLFLSRDPQLESLPDLKTVQQQGGRAIVPRPENRLPFGHELGLGQTQRFGDILVTPLRVTRGPLRFAHVENEANHYRLDSAPVLKLWLRFENVSVERSITPIDSTLMYFRRAFDGHMASFNVIFKSADRFDPKAKYYYLFDRLAPDSEWRIDGQQINNSIAPRSTLETFIPSEEQIESLVGNLVWRVHFRKGYGPKSGNGVTTLIDVHFHSDDVIPDSV